MANKNGGSDDKSSPFNMAELGAAALSAEDREGLVNALKNKLQNLAGQHSDFIESLSEPVRKRVTVLQEIQSQHDELEAKFFEEKAVLEAKYQKLYEPLYSKRHDIVNGIVEVENRKSGTVEENTADDKWADERGVPGFWVTAMKNNEVLAEEISERDEGALKYLKDILWARIENPKGFKLEFFFETNPYFKNSLLTKIYHIIDDDEPILERAIGTDIDWYPGKILTQKILKKKPKKGSKNAKPITKTEDCESFFNFFNPPQAEQLQSLMKQDYDIGSTIRDKIIPHAVSWYTGEAAQTEDFEGIEVEDDDEDDDEDEEDELDEDDEDEEEEDNKVKKKAPHVRKKADAAQGNDGQQGERPPECKQQ